MHVSQDRRETGPCPRFAVLYKLWHVAVQTVTIIMLQEHYSSGKGFTLSEEALLSGISETCPISQLVWHQRGEQNLDSRCCLSLDLNPETHSNQCCRKVHVRAEVQGQCEAKVFHVSVLDQ